MDTPSFIPGNSPIATGQVQAANPRTAAWGAAVQARIAEAEEAMGGPATSFAYLWARAVEWLKANKTAVLIVGGAVLLLVLFTGKRGRR